jgi:hypothetical protein
VKSLDAKANRGHYLQRACLQPRWRCSADTTSRRGTSCDGGRGKGRGGAAEQRRGTFFGFSWLMIVLLPELSRPTTITLACRRDAEPPMSTTAPANDCTHARAARRQVRQHSQTDSGCGRLLATLSDTLRSTERTRVQGFVSAAALRRRTLPRLADWRDGLEATAPGRCRPRH